MDKLSIRKWPLLVLCILVVMGLLAVMLPSLQPAVNLAVRNLPPAHPHWMGTDALGRDVMASVVVGGARSLTIGIGAALLGGVFGVVMGSVSGYFGNRGLRPAFRSYLSALLSMAAAAYGLLVVLPVARAGGVSFGGVITLLVIFSVIVLLHRTFRRFNLLGRRFALPLDHLVQRFTEVFSVIPRLYLILIFSMVVPVNLLTMILLFALTSWATMSRLVRAEMVRVNAMPFIESARVLGLTDSRVFFRHALPNAVGPVATQLCFTMAGLLIAEATLSFLGVGVSPEVVSWGSIIHGYLENLQAWWLAFFPGLLIYAAVVSLHALAGDLDRYYHRHGQE